MVWVYLGLILASIVYAAFIIGQYSLFSKDIRPKIRTLKDRAEKFEKAVEAEIGRYQVAQRRVEEARSWMTDQNREISRLAGDIQQEKLREEQLEMENYKRQFKRSNDY